MNYLFVKMILGIESEVAVIESLIKSKDVPIFHLKLTEKKVPILPMSNILRW